MTQLAINYAKALCELGISEDVVSEAKKVVDENKELVNVITSPVVSENAKHSIIEKVFNEKEYGQEFVNFLKLLCDYHCFDLIYEIFDAYRQCKNEDNQIADATLICVTPPDKEQFEGIKKYLIDKEKLNDVRINIIQDKSIIGGFILKYKDREYDWSLTGKIKALHTNLVRR